MKQEHKKERLALQGGMKAVGAIEGRGDPKIGVEEFMSLAERFGFQPQALERIRAVVDGEEWGAGPFLANYYSGLKESKVQAFERTARDLFGTKFAMGVSSGTGALHAAFVAVGVGPGTEVICPAIGFIATALAVVQAGGIPVFCDVDESLSMDPDKIEGLITPRTVAIAPTCIMGSVPDMKRIMAVARRRRLKVVEDCAQSCGGKFKGRYVGTFGDAGCFSISAYKTVGAGEGGLLLANRKRIWERASQVTESGGLWRPIRFAQPRYAGELFCGTNYRMSELEAAVDVVQLGRMPAINRRFNAVKQRITKRLKTYRDIRPQMLNDAEGELGYQLRFFPVSVNLAQQIADALKAEGIAANTRGGSGAADWHIYSYMFPVTEKRGSTEVNCPFECPVYRERGGQVSYARGDCPVADDLFERVVSINLNQWYTAADCRRIAAGINKVLSAFCSEDPAAPAWR